MGYGIPDFKIADQNITDYDSVLPLEMNSFSIAENNILKSLIIRFESENSIQQATVRVYSVTGKIMLSLPITHTSTVISTSGFTSGIYAVCVTENGKTDTRKIIIN